MKMRVLQSVAIACVAALAVVGVAWGGATVSDLTADVSPHNPGTRARPENVAMELAVRTRGAPGEEAATVARITVFLPKELVLSARRFPSCRPSFLTAGRERRCRRAKVGTGEASVTAFGPVQDLKVNPSVTAYNGSRGKTLLLHLEASTPTVINSAITGRLQRVRHPRYGNRYVFTIPQELREPSPGLRATVSDLRFELEKQRTVRRRKRRFKIPYIGLGSCRDGVLSFKSVTAYSAPQPAPGPSTGSDTVNCG
jgi:hypothetical protein